MIRLPLSVGFVLWGALIGSPIVKAQEAQKSESPAKAPATESKADPIKTPETTAVGAEQGAQAVIQGQQSPQTFGAQRVTNFVRYYTPQNSAAPRNQNQVIYRKVAQADGPAAAIPFFGLSLSDADDALRSQLEIPSGEGVVIVAVSPKGLGHDAGLKPNDVLLSLGDKPAKSVAEVQKMLLDLTREAIPVKLIRQGKRTQLSVVGPEHGQPPEPTEFWVGVPVSPVDATLRAHLPSLVEDAGLVANDVVKDSPAEAAGLKKNDILITFAESKPLRNSEDLIAAIQASEGKPSPLTILRAGKPLTLTVTPSKRAKASTLGVEISADGHYYQVRMPYSTVVYPFQANQDSLTFSPANPAGATINRGIGVLPPREMNPAKDRVSQQVINSAQGIFNTELHKNLPQDQIHLKLMTNPAPPPIEDKTAKIEAELKELSGKLDQILKELKKSDKQ
jgi:membrane-associated protease RseP (regulator of RpoE activity)